MRRTVLALLVVYLGFLADVTLLRFHGDPGVDLLPFHAIVRDVWGGGRALWVNVLGNVGVFLPLGVALPLIRSRPTRAWHVGAAAFALSAAIELAQYAIGRRVADIDDVVMNTAGALIGYAVAAPWRRGRAQ